MMAIVIVDQGCRIFLNAMFDDNAYHVHLYMVDTPLTTSTKASDLTEVVAPWYEPLQTMNWSDAVTTGSFSAIYADPLIWTVGEVVVPLTVFGYWVSIYAAGALVWAERVPQGGIAMDQAGTQVAVYPRMTFRNDPFPT